MWAQSEDMDKIFTRRGGNGASGCWCKEKSSTVSVDFRDQARCDWQARHDVPLLAAMAHDEKCVRRGYQGRGSLASGAERGYIQERALAQAGPLIPD
jgi:hypothetical protein